MTLALLTDLAAVAATQAQLRRAENLIVVATPELADEMGVSRGSAQTRLLPSDVPGRRAMALQAALEAFLARPLWPGGRVLGFSATASTDTYLALAIQAAFLVHGQVDDELCVFRDGAFETSWYPRLRHALGPEWVEDHAGSVVDLEAHTRRLALRDRVPDRVQVMVRSGAGEIALFSGDEEYAHCRVPPFVGATLALFAEYAARGGRVPLEALYSEEAETLRRIAHRVLVGNLQTLRPWESRDDVSKAISRLNRGLSRDSAVLRWCGVEKDGEFYRWSERSMIKSGLRLELLTDRPEIPYQEWGFRHIPRPLFLADR